MDRRFPVFLAPRDVVVFTVVSMTAHGATRELGLLLCALLRLLVVRRAQKHNEERGDVTSAPFRTGHTR